MGPYRRRPAIAFGNGVPGLAHLVPELAAIGFAGLFKAAAFGIELPAVIAAADAVLLDLAIIERGAAMAAEDVQIAHETIVAGAMERNPRLLERLGKDDVAMLLGHIDRLTDTAAKMLDAEKDLS